jgi:DNA-binding Lrp family transcriptional regulator
LRTPNKDAADFLTRILPFVEQDGARNLNLISRELSIPYQTLWTRMMNLNKDGIIVAPTADYDKIGLERARVFFRLSPSIKDETMAFFGGLHQSAGLKLYARSLDNHIFDCEFALPKGTVGELQKLLEKLEELQFIRNVEVKKILWKDVLMLKTEFYDYSKHAWDVDFTKLSGDPSKVSIPTKNEQERFDYNDLFFIKEMEMDSWVKLVDLARKAHLQVGDAAYHFNRHVMDKGLIKYFRLKWSGPPKAWFKHSIISETYVFKKISDEDTRHAMSVLTSVPFSWSHMRMEDGTYMAEVILPLSQYLEGRQYISSQLRALDLAPELLEKDWSCLSTYTIPYLLYNREKSRWDFNAENALDYTLQMIRAYSR